MGIVALESNRGFGLSYNARGGLLNMHNSAAPILIFVAALGAALVLLVNGRFVGTKLGVLDHPDAVRKIHPQVTPLTIGLAIMAAVIVWAGGTFVWNPTPNSQLLLTVLLCGAGATLVGYIDDQTPISASSRLLFLFLLSAIAIVIEPDLLPSQINWTHFGPLLIAPWFACIFIAVAMAGFVNAVNMADGQNGVVLGMFIIWSACLILTTRGHTQSAALILFGASFISFFFNMAGRAFLGDSGSYGVSFVFGLLAIRAHNHWGVSAETIAVWFFIPVSGLPPTYGDTIAVWRRSHLFGPKSFSSSAAGQGGVALRTGDLSECDRYLVDHCCAHAASVPCLHDRACCLVFQLRMA